MKAISRSSMADAGCPPSVRNATSSSIGCGDYAASGEELGADLVRVEVHALGNEVGSFEDEDGGDAHPKGPAGRGGGAVLTGVRSHEPELHDHRVVGMVQRDELVVLGGKGHEAQAEVLARR